MLRVAAYTEGRNTPSARFRIRQFISQLADAGIDIREFPSLCGKYPPASRMVRPAWAAGRVIEGAGRALGSYRHDLVLFQRELLSTMVTLEPLYRRPRILDVDDAIWLHRRGSFALRLAGQCDGVICGNSYLADYFFAGGRPVYILPTAVDTQKFIPKPPSDDPGNVIGWSGTASNLRFLEQIEPSLEIVMQRFPDLRLRVVCDRAPQFRLLSPARVEYVPWTPSIEVAALQDLRVGLMPLEDTAWARGKCAFKMLTYMACGVPVVVSPVGMNQEVLAMGDVGYGPRHPSEWVDALSAVLENHGLAKSMGDSARFVVERHFSVDVLAPRLAEILRRVVGSGVTVAL